MRLFSSKRSACSTLSALAGIALVALAACEAPTAAPLSSAQPPEAPGSGAALPPGHPPIAPQGMGPHGGAQPGTHGGSMPAPGPAAEAPIAYKMPAAWAKVDHPSRMRLATHKVPRAEGDGEDAELTVSIAGGDTASNIARWKGQFTGGSPGKEQDRSTADLKITIVELDGAYQGMGMQVKADDQPKASYGMLAAIVSIEGSSESTFFKLTGPKKTVDAARAGFDELVSSFARR